MSRADSDKKDKGTGSTELPIEQDTSTITETHSQDADRHRGIKHPVSDK